MDNVKTWLRAERRTVAWLAKQCGISASHMGAALNGRRKIIPRLLIAIEHATGLDLGAKDDTK